MTETDRKQASGKMVSIRAPSNTWASVRQRAFDQGTTVRAVMLSALKKDGHPVDDIEIQDKREKDRRSKD